MPKITLSFPIVSAIQKINLPTAIKKCYAIRINQVSFSFTKHEQKVLLLSIQGLDTNKYFDGIKSTNYSFIYFNNGSLNTINYLNNITISDSNFPSRNIEYLDIITKIDDQLDSSISKTNVLHIAIDFFCD